MSDRDDLFVRGANGTVIGLAVEGHPDAAPDADVITAMVPIVPIPESATIGPLPDVIEQANELAIANARIAELEARLSSAPAGKTEAEQAADRIAELEAQLAKSSSSSSAADPAPPSPSAPSSPLTPAPVVAEVPTAPASSPAWADLASGAKAPADPTA